MDEQHYLKMLTEIAREMGERELQGMLFMCPFIPKGIRAELSSPLQLWQCLEERDKLSREDTSFLRELLENATGNRTDLLNILNKYESSTVHVASSSSRFQSQPSPLSEGPDMQQAFDVITTELGKNWRQVARKLKLTEADIDFCVESHPKDLKEQIRKALLIWARNTDGTKEELSQALVDSQQVLLAQKINKLC